VSTLVHELVARQAESHPRAVAVETHGTAISYADLDRGANRVARTLREYGCRRGDRVCVLSPTTPNAVVAMLGIFKADAIYVPLDPAVFEVHGQAIVRSCRPACVLTAGFTAIGIESLVDSGALEASTVIGSLERTPIAGQSFFTRFSLGDIGAGSDRPVASRNRPTNPASVVFSGARAGEPRGVVITHESLARSASGTAALFGLRAGDRVPAMSRPNQDQSVIEVVSALVAGATVLPVGPEVTGHARRLAEFLRRARVTSWGAAADGLALLADADAVLPGDFPALKHVFWWGSDVPARVLRYWMTRVGHTSFTSLYGSAETAAIAHHRWTRDRVTEAGLRPVGATCPGQQILVLDSRLEPVEPGIVGDLWARGVGLSAGYWGDPAATADAFRWGPLGATGSERMWRTGDRGQYGNDGRVYLVGLKKSDSAPLGEGGE
jgi:non-ribosomal peptide synthetase component F